MLVGLGILLSSLARENPLFSPVQAAGLGAASLGSALLVPLPARCGRLGWGLTVPLAAAGAWGGFVVAGAWARLSTWGWATRLLGAPVPLLFSCWFCALVGALLGLGLGWLQGALTTNCSRKRIVE